MTKNIKNEGAAMKKLTLLLVVAALATVGIVSVAYASTTSDYAAWSTAYPNNGTVLQTPHKDFRTTTVKCAVCHAVHKASATGEVLLRSTVANSCLFCHVDATAVGNIRLYGGVAANYNGSDLPVAHGGTGASECVDCHTIHGANSIGGDVSAKILKAGSYQATASAHYLDTAPRNEQVTLFCTRCHPYFTDEYDTQTTGDIFTTAGKFSSHVMTDADAAYNPGAHVSYNGQVTNVDSKYCRDCHDAGNVDESATNFGATLLSTDNFPHYTANASRFLMGGAYSGDTTADVGSALSSASVDGVCLKCHSWNAGANGVGDTF